MPRWMRRRWRLRRRLWGGRRLVEEYGKVMLGIVSSLVEVGLKDGFGKSKGITLLLDVSTGCLEIY